MARLFTKLVVILLFPLVINGCASGRSSLQEEARTTSKETLLLKTADSEKLIAFYKAQLKEKESAELRMKLIEAYLQSGDVESAAFHIAEIDFDEKNAANVVFLKARVAYLTGEYIQAYQYAQTALSLSTAYPEAENLMGLIQAERGELVSAREHFLMARRHYYDDAVVKNNLAVIDLIEEDYQSAVDKLQPLYLKGEADRKIISNLAIAYAKLGEYKAVKRVLEEQNYSEEQIQRIFLALRKATSLHGENHQETESPLVTSEPISATELRVKVNRGSDYEAD